LNVKIIFLLTEQYYYYMYKQITHIQIIVLKYNFFICDALDAL